MSDPFLDTDIIVRLLTGDDIAKQAAAANLFEEIAAGRITVMAPDTVIADTVYVLSSRRLYGLSREQVYAVVTPLLRLPAFRVANRRTLVRSLDLYRTTSVGFGDALIVAAMEQAGSMILYSYDRHFDDFSGLVRQEPPRHEPHSGGNGAMSS